MSEEEYKSAFDQRAVDELIVKDNPSDYIELAPKQQEAVLACIDIDNRVVLVTGPAGTGKTTIIRRVYRALREAGYQGALCAPTGKAAKRIYEATGIPALTIHRLLEYTHPGDPDPKTGKPVGYSYPRRTRQKPLELDFVIIDEAMMTSDELNRNIFDALPPGARIMLFGDGNQLAPVEEDKNRKTEDAPFLQLMANPKFTTIKLETVFRQGKDSGILMNCELILKGRIPSKNDQWTMKYTDLTIHALQEYLLDMDHEGISFQDVSNQVIVPQNKGGVGTKSINTIMQNIYQNELDNEHILIDRHTWYKTKKDEDEPILKLYVGDKIIQTKNNYDLGVFNGETGIVKDIDFDTGEITIDFGDREQVIPPLLIVQNKNGDDVTIDPRKDIDLGYAITTHKAQGSEYARIVYIINKSNFYMLSRRNFYTAASRAKQHVHLLTDQRGLHTALSKRD